MRSSGVKPGPLSKFDKILKSWVRTNNSILESWSPDVPWRYNERSSISTLAGCIWRLRGIAIEEFDTEKGYSNAPRSKQHATGDKIWGRCDLYFEYADIECEIEAKFYRPEIDKNLKPQKELANRLDKAVQDASRNYAYDNRLRVGLLITTPYISIEKLALWNESNRNLEASLGLWVDAAKSIPDAAVAWFFPRNLQVCSFVNSRYCSHHFPGVIILLKQIKTQSS